jgi:hypothetical protein
MPKSLPAGVILPIAKRTGVLRVCDLCGEIAKGGIHGSREITK